jgi:putative ABC transport system permease protein
MFRTTLKNLAAHKLRLVTTSVAVLLGVAFMVGTLVLTDTIGATFDGLFADVNAGTDAYVRGETAFSTGFGDQRARLDADLVGTVAGVDGVEVAEGSVEAYAQLVDPDGDPIGDPTMGAPTLGVNWLSSDALNPFDIAEGRPPATDTEVVIDRGSAEAGGFAVGEPVRVLTQTGSHQFDIVGIATFGAADSPAGASVVAFTDSAAETHLVEEGKVDAIKVIAEAGTDGEQLVARIAEVVPRGVEVLTGAEITAENQTEMEEGLAFFNTFLLAFALIALFVGSFIIYNTFSILVAQRSKEMALLRALGASRRQVLGSVLIEAVAVGLVSSVLGLVAGIGVASLLQALLAGMGLDIPAGDTVVTTGTVVVALVAGLGVSVASAIFPARRAAKVPPIAAMRDVAVDTSGRSRSRLLAGAAVTGVGAAAMAGGLFAGAGIVAVGSGVVLVFLGVAVLGPVLAGPLSRLIGWPLPRLKGMTGTLARENALRNPKRTSATAAALMIGVALVGFITILASSTKASVNETVDAAFTGDFVVDSGAFDSGGLSPEFTRQLNELPEVGAATGIRVAMAEVDGAGTTLFAADPETMDDIFDVGLVEGSLQGMGATDIAVLQSVAEDEGLAIGDTVPVRFAATGEQELTVAAIYTERDLAGTYFLGLPAYDANVADHFDFQVFVTVADGVSAEAAEAAILAVADDHPQASVQDRTAYKEAQSAPVDQLLNLVYALLALAVLIALLGIANTLALSIFERTRELGLLRAVGMTRGQLRATVRWESVIIALLGTTLGLSIGVLFGWAMVEALASEGLNTFVVPGAQLAVVAVIAGLAGVAAAVLPARRAGRLDVLGAIVSD